MAKHLGICAAGHRFKKVPFNDGASVVNAVRLNRSHLSSILDHHRLGQKKKGGFFGWFNRIFEAGNRGYTSCVNYIIGRGGRHFVIYLTIVGVMGFLFTRLPKSFLPDEDHGILFAQVTTPSGTSQK
jgi:multidrug efflux pump subunit AcrB